MKLFTVRFFDRLFYVLVCMVGLFAAAAIYLVGLNRQTTDAITRAARYDLAWTCVQAKIEVANLGQILGVYSVDPSRSHLKQLRLQSDIVGGRTESLNAGEFGRLLSRNAAVAARLQDYVRLSTALESTLTGPLNAETLIRAHRQAEDLQNGLEPVCSSIQQDGAVAVAASQTRLRNAHDAALVLIMGLIGSGLGLISILVIQNRITRVASENYEYLANHDILTGLPNRSMFLAALEHTLADPAGSRPVAVLTLDLDRFKIINDTLGHAAGDQLLKSVAHRLDELRQAGSIGLAARLGGDEFVALVGSADIERTAPGTAQTIIERIRAPHRIDGHQVTVDATIGLAFGEPGVSGAAEVMRKSDVALNWAKALERGTWGVFEPEMDTQVQNRRALEMDLTAALINDEFEVHYQPFVDLQSGEIRGVEALLRWRHPSRGMIPPDVFIPIAEETGLIVQIGRRALLQACRDALVMPKPWKVAVNLSAVQFLRDELMHTIDEVLDATGLEPRRLELEITESIMLGDERKVQEVLKQLRALGVHIALDDFGTGYSSLSYLRRFEFNKLKIDQAFIPAVATDDAGLEFVKAIVELGRVLGMSITAEGIETAAQQQALTSAGCTFGQGYLFAKPMPLAELIDQSNRKSVAQELAA